MIDNYCERTGPEFWAEPLNAVTNAAFLIAAWAAWRLARSDSALTPGIWALIATTAVIGVGSFSFHTVPVRATLLMDVLPILVFQLIFLWLYARGPMALPPLACAALLGTYLALGYWAHEFAGMLNGSPVYFPALAVLIALGLHHAATMPRHRLALLAAAGVLILSLTFRTVDEALCGAVPAGTHFLWHLLNGVVLYLAIRALALRRAVRP